MMKLSRAIEIAKLKLKNNQKNITHYFAHILKVNQIDILTSGNVELSSKHLKKLFKFIMLSNKNFPYAYIVKNMPFLENDFYVNTHCLIPREDSATIIELLDDYFINNNSLNSKCDTLNILELGVGSGCLILSILQKYPNIKALGVDIRSNTLKVVKRNAKLLRLNRRINFLLSDMFNNIPAQKFDVIISNPPYIDIADWQIEDSVKKFEPKIALFAKNNGLYFYEEIFKNSDRYLTSKGIIIVEIGINQEEDIVLIANIYDYKLLASRNDSSNICRALLFKK